MLRISVHAFLNFQLYWIFSFIHRGTSRKGHCPGNMLCYVMLYLHTARCNNSILCTTQSGSK